MNSIENPCLKKCFIGDGDICYGCYRTFNDIISWKTCTETEKSKILCNAKIRKESQSNKKYWYAFQTIN